MAFVVTIPGHSFSVNDVVFVDDINWVETVDSEGNPVNPNQLNGTYYTVTNVAGNDVTLGFGVTEGTFDVSADFANINDVKWNADGTKMYVLGLPTLGQWSVAQYVTSTPYDVTTAAASSGTFAVITSGGFQNTTTHYAGQMMWSTGGTKFFFLDREEDGLGVDDIIQVVEYTAGTAFDVTTLVRVDATDFRANYGDTDQLDGMTFSADGTKVYLASSGGGAGGASEYALTTAWDISTASTTPTTGPDISLNGEDGLFFSPTGDKIFLVNSSGQILTYPLSTAYSLASVGSLENTFEPSPVNAHGGTWRPDCRTMYSVRTNFGQLVSQYTVAASAGDCDLAEDIDGTGLDTYFSGGTIYETATSVSGNDHLEGEEVCAVADGQVFCGLTVTDGVVTGWGFAASRVHVGLPFITDIETLNVTSSDGDASQATTKSVALVSLVFFKSLDNVLVGPNENQLTLMDANTLGANDTPILIGDGENEFREIHIEPDWNSNGRIFIRQVNPSPLTILAVVPEFDEEDDASGGQLG